MNKKTLNSLFKPYILRFQTLDDLKGINPRLNKFVDKIKNIGEIKESQCSKSADRTCANIGCCYNLLKYNYLDNLDCSDGDVDA